MSQESVPDDPQQIESSPEKPAPQTADEASDLPRPDLPPSHYLNWSKDEVIKAREAYDAYEDLGGMPVREAAELEEE